MAGMAIKNFVVVSLVNDAVRANPTLGFVANTRYVREIAAIIASGVERIVADALGAHSSPRIVIDGVRYGTLKRIRGLVSDYVSEWMDVDVAKDVYAYRCRNVIAAALADGCADGSEKDVIEIVAKFVAKYTKAETNESVDVNVLELLTEYE